MYLRQSCCNKFYQIMQLWVVWKCLKLAFLSFIVLYYKSLYTFQTNSLSLCNIQKFFLLYKKKKKKVDFPLWFCLVQNRGSLFWGLSSFWSRIFLFRFSHFSSYWRSSVLVLRRPYHQRSLAFKGRKIMENRLRS